MEKLDHLPSEHASQCHHLSCVMHHSDTIDEQRAASSEPTGARKKGVSRVKLILFATYYKNGTSVCVMCVVTLYDK